MDRNFAEIAFSEAVKALQERHGSRSTYERLKKQTVHDGLSENEIDFIETRDSFYMASIGESGFPYIQHRGGPRGFLKVLDKHRIGFIDFTGNKQYVSVGNIATHDKVALIMVDYPARARLKIYATATVVELKDDDELLARLELDHYEYKPERMLVLAVQAYDWNCPQHITPRYTVNEIERAFAPLKEKVAKQEEEIQRLKSLLQKGN
jgi:uncharacterized protein